ncbi:MAG: phosphoadenylyl-sulfate reductase [Gammaproteobacteria bacterium]|nr:phosphoadenylyl-sulfate reductase [Gammaproteobacteria bacterium]
MPRLQTTHSTESSSFKAALTNETIEQYSAALTPLSAQQRIAWSLEHFPGAHALSSSFGIQSAVMLHMASTEQRDLPVILIDTGHLFPETYQFIEELTERLRLNLKVYQPPMTGSRQEAILGKLWEQGLDGITKYNWLNKEKPMKRALQQLRVKTWFAGIRRGQSGSRANLPVVAGKFGCFKVHPIVDWSDRDVYRYLNKHKLPYHPLWEKGYVSVGDTHTTRPLEPGMLEEETRFFGLKRECGLHD